MTRRCRFLFTLYQILLHFDNKNYKNFHCVKSVRIRSYGGPYSVRMRENTDQNNSKYGHFSRKVGVKKVQTDSALENRNHTTIG